ncbi:MAG: DNA-protecting protein DprA [Gammaproteobacteria bacterium]|nr:MAG: DNA-protecting protein DprA [Gammaproteobacteria bacterium]
MSDLIRWLNLCRLPGLGARTLAEIADVIHCPDALPEVMVRAKPRGKAVCERLEAVWGSDRLLDERDVSSLHWAETPGCALIPLYDAAYPALLRTLTDPPPVLYVKGQVEALHGLQLGLVGTRKPSPSARQATDLFAAALTEMGVTVTSGLALGVDGLAHAAALRSGGCTVAVLGGGVERVYPRQHQALASAILDGGGALVSEMPPDTPASARLFPRRNRIISGLSAGILVIEASERSGSLITARLAAEQGRDVYAVPGAWNNPQALGSNRLIKQGAKPVDCVDDLKEELQSWFSFWAAANPHAASGMCQARVAPGEAAKEADETAHAAADVLDPAMRALLSEIDHSVTSIDALVARLNRPAHELSAELLRLELEGWVSSVPGGVVRLR